MLCAGGRSGCVDSICFEIDVLFDPSFSFNASIAAIIIWKQKEKTHYKADRTGNKQGNNIDRHLMKLSPQDTEGEWRIVAVTVVGVELVLVLALVLEEEVGG